MKSLLVLLSFSCWLFIDAAHAQYTCNDRVYLQEALAKLNRDCGGGGSLCQAKGYKASTLEKAVEACVKNHWSENTCLQDVTCEGSIAICQAKGFKGSTLEKAVELCVRNHWSENTCIQDVTCDNATVCQAKGFKGSTVESAIATCVKNHWRESTCQQDVTCR